MLLRVALFVPVAVNHANTGIFRQAFSMFDHEAPIEAIEWSGLLADFLFHLVMARSAIVAHFLNVAAACGVRFGGDPAAIGKLAHAACVG